MCGYKKGHGSSAVLIPGKQKKAGQEEFSCSGPEVPGASSFQRVGWQDQALTFPLLHQIHARIGNVSAQS